MMPPSKIVSVLDLVKPVSLLGNSISIFGGGGGEETQAHILSLCGLGTDQPNSSGGSELV